MLHEGLCLPQQGNAKQFEILKNAFGTGRLTAELNDRGCLAYMQVPDMLAMLNEALPVAA